MALKQNKESSMREIKVIRDKNPLKNKHYSARIQNPFKTQKPPTVLLKTITF